MWGLQARHDKRTPASLLPLWDIDGDTLITSHGCHLQLFEVSGVPSEYMEAHDLLSMADGLKATVKRDWPTDLFVHFVSVNGRDAVDIDVEARGSSNAKDPMLAHQRAERTRFLRDKNLRRLRLYLAVGCAKGMSAKEFVRCDPLDHKKRLKKAADYAQLVRRSLFEAGRPRGSLRIRALGREEIIRVLQSLCNPGAHHHGQVGDDAPGWAMSLREKIVRCGVSWKAQYVQTDATFHRVLTLASLPEHTRFAMMEGFLTFKFDLRLSVALRVPNQEGRRRQTTMHGNMTHSMVQGLNPHRPSGMVKSMASEAQDLDDEVANTGQQYIDCGMQAVISAPSLKGLEAHTEEFEGRMRSLGFLWHRETGAHDLEYFKTLPGMAPALDRWRTILSDHAVDVMPLFGTDHGDREATCLLRTARGEMFKFDPAEEKRNHWNGTVFGAAGTGKSVFVNLLLATSFLGGKKPGPVMILDYAGEEKSSYAKLLRLTGGLMVQVGTDRGVTINPLPSRATAVDPVTGQLRSTAHNEVAHFLTLLLDVKGDSTEDKIDRNILEAAIVRLYQGPSGIDEPILSDYLEALRGLKNDQDIEDERLRMLTALLGQFLRSPNARFFDQKTALRLDSPLVVFDMHGLQDLPRNVAAATSFAVIKMIRNRAFGDEFKDRIKWILIDEGAQQQKEPQFVWLLDQLLCTSRKHLTGVWVITQNYSAYQQSGLHQTVATNTTSQVFFSHGDAPDAMRGIIEDFSLGERQAHIFSTLQTHKGEFAQALLKTVSFDADTKEMRNVCTKVQVELSPFDYEVTTSDGHDRRRLDAVLARQAEPDLFAALKFLADERARPHA